MPSRTSRQSQVDQLRDATLRALQSPPSAEENSPRWRPAPRTDWNDDTWLARLVQRGVAIAHGTEFPDDAAGRRAPWRLVSVTPDEVSGTLLAPTATTRREGWRERALRERAEHHAKTHLTPRDLRSLRLSLPTGTLIHIFENPRVVEAAADAACVQPLVCTSGSTATVVFTLLDTLAATGCRFAYHSDFD